MHFGIFIEERRRGVSEADAFREAMELVDASEAWGLDGVWLGEIHFNGMRSVQSSPLALSAYIAGRTKRVRIGTAVQVLPLTNPIRIAEDVATVDHLSGGRFDFGIGRSGSPRAYDALGIPYGESQGRFLESLEVIREAWKGKPFSYDGEFYKIKNVTVSPTPVQAPHPPLRMAANSEETFIQVGQLGIPLFVGLRDHDVASLRPNLKAYREAWRAAGNAGNPDVCLRIPIYGAPTAREAEEEPRESMTSFFQRHVELLKSGMGRDDTGSASRRAHLAEKTAKMTYEELLRTRVAFGTGAEMRERFAELREDLGLDGVIIELNPAGLLSMEQMLRSLKIFTHEVLPKLR